VIPVDAGREPWQPGLDNGDETLLQAYLRMPKDSPQSIPWYVSMLEHPASPLALPGAVSLFEHDCIHLVLGRGLASRDEAFVLGFTMGSSRSCTRWQRELFLVCAQRLYRGSFRFSKADTEVYELAFETARTSNVEPLDQPNYRDHLPLSLANVREALGISVEKLRTLYEIERSLSKSP